MPTLPVRYPIGDFTILFFKQYKELGIYSLSQAKVTDIHELTNGRKLWIDSSTNELVIEAAPSTSLYKTAYSMTTSSICLSSCALIIGNNDTRQGTISTDTYVLDNLSECPNVVLKWTGADQLCVSTTCGDANCSAPKAACKVTSLVDAEIYS